MTEETKIQQEAEALYQTSLPLTDMMKALIRSKIYSYIAGASTRIPLLAEIERLKSASAYWKNKCELAEECLRETPCDPDITGKQVVAWKNYKEFINQFGELPEPPK